ncbi:hypothetical protein K474DRAFT_1772858 [Panus rudis PR-1116 ss-1]|nr:hypothetical protein K474DRAFT_1772858 [Panus rudis PR-1116 ss-1]
MDSEDEADYRRQRLEGDLRYGVHSGRGLGLELRRHEEEEARAAENCYIPMSQREATCQIRPSDRPRDWAAICRVRRFFETYRGFYTGDVDLTGRHLPRFKSISKRFMEFANDFLFILKVYGKMGNREEQDALGKMIKVPDYVFDPIEPYDEFLMKWNCAGSFTPTEFKEHILRNMDLVLGPARPKIQTLCLHHLPPELLMIITKNLSPKDALHLGSTCRLLRELSIPFIHDDVTIRLPFPYALRTVLADSELSDRYHMLAVHYRYGQERVIEQLRFLRRHPNYTQKIKYLRVVDKSAPDLHKYEWELREDFLSPPLLHSLQKNVHSVDRLLPAILSRSPNVRNLHFMSWKITMPILKSLASMTQLRRLEFFDCAASFDVAAELSALPSELSVTNMSLSHYNCGEEHVLDLWLVTRACPHLQHLTFGVQTDDYYRISIPLTEFTTVVNPFKTLRTVILDNLVPVDVQMLSTWISLVNSPLPLERFKLVVEGGLNRQEILQLLNALSPAKLKYLVIDGLRWAEPVLLGQIAQTFPDLVSLILHYRESGIQYKSKPAVWPYTSGEYAPHLANLQHLRHFGWNFRQNVVFHPGWTFQFFEDGFPREEESRDPESRNRDLTGDDLSVNEGILLANVLGAYCPSLKWVSDGREFGSCYTRDNGRYFGFTDAFCFGIMSICDPTLWARYWEVQLDGSVKDILPRIND